MTYHPSAATSIRPDVGMKVLYELETVDGRQRVRRVIQLDRDDIPLPNSIFR